MSTKKPMMLLIMDGFGLNENSYGNAISQAKTPNLDRIFSKYPITKLNACGEFVGLPKGQMGNSEVGHLNIGAGRIIYQDLTRITKEAENGALFKNKALSEAMENAKKADKTLHFFGLLSDGGVHSHIDHLFSLMEMAENKGLTKVALHCFLDGRDVPPRCAKEYISALETKISELGIGEIATISGRYYAMDRDKRWERVKSAYDAMTLGQGKSASTATQAIDNAYGRGENDEFVFPTVVARTTVQDGDSVIMFNFRPDRAREITRAFVDENFDGFERTKTLKDLTYVCMTEYDASMPNVKIAYPPETYKNTLGEYIASLGMHQLRIAETEKYAHVTFFFNGGVEEPNKNEDRILVPSPKVATYDLQPEMCAQKVTSKVIDAIEKDIYDMIILNFANADMVGHTGVMDAAIKAIETLDSCIPQIEAAVLEAGGQILLTADHGNADVMLDSDGNAVTSHSLNKVPLVHISHSPSMLSDGGKLADIAPTMLDLMGLEIPKEMTGNSLVKK